MEKFPISDLELRRVIEIATKHSEDARKMVLTLAYTGMHISVLIQPWRKLREEKHEGKPYITWYRPKKEGKDARVTCPKHNAINFNVEMFAKEIQKRRRKKSRQYFWNLTSVLGYKCGIPNLSPMTFRHTCAVMMLDMGIPQVQVQDILNCSNKTLRTYLKYSTRRTHELFERVGWF